MQTLLLLRAGTALSLFIPLPLFAQAARSDNSIRVTLESAYEAWRGAMAASDLQLWEQTTAFSRQIETRNRIVSQQAPFPQALFDDPVEAPALGGLIALGVFSTGETATSTYFGKANFGSEPGVGVSDNILVLHFLRENERWKFDNLRIVKIGNDGEILLQIRNGDLSFLQGAEFQPAPHLPPVLQPVERPQMIGEAWIDATGYEVKLTVNGHPTGTFRNIKTAELVMGGLRRGQNQVKIETRILEGESSSSAPKVELAIYAAENPGAPANRVFHFQPGTSVAPLLDEIFVVE